jgi:hypothetical protein
VLVIEALWERLGIGKELRDICKAKKIKVPYERALLAMVANRLCEPESKLGVWDRWLSAYSGDLGRLNRRKSAACSGRSRPPKPEQSGHRSERSDAGFNYFSNF